jgi:hypothetical protein
MTKKRFTDANKWEDPWFMELPLEMKALWQFVCDKCDNAGVWDPNKRLAEMLIGTSIDWKLAVNVFEGRVNILPNGKWFLTKFIRFQYPGGLSRKCSPHQQVLGLLEGYGIPAEPYLSEPLPNPYPTVASRVADRVPSTLQDKDKDTDSPSPLSLKGSAEGKQTATSREDFVAFLGTLRCDTHESAVDEWIGWLRKLGIKDWQLACECVGECVRKARKNGFQVRYSRNLPESYGDEWKYWFEKRSTQRITKESA